jgi:hypothetical protein
VTERVTLVLPRESGFEAVADLVLAGLGARLDLTLDVIDDLQLALENVLGVAEGDGEITVSFEAEGDAVGARIGPFARTAIDAALDGRAPFDLRRVLETVVDTVELREQEDGWHVELRKRAPLPAGSA